MLRNMSNFRSYFQYLFYKLNIQIFAFEYYLSRIVIWCLVEQNFWEKIIISTCMLMLMAVKLDAVLSDAASADSAKFQTTQWINTSNKQCSFISYDSIILAALRLIQLPITNLSVILPFSNKCTMRCVSGRRYAGFWTF